MADVKGTKPIEVDGDGQEPIEPTTATEPEITPETPVDVDSLPVNVQNLIRETRRDAAKQRKKAEGLEADAAKAQEDDLAKKQEWEALATQRGERIVELEGAQAERDTYRETLVETLMVQVEGWPEEMKAMVPDTDDPVVLQKFIQKAAPAVDKLVNGKVTPGVSNTPKSVGSPGGPSPEEVGARKKAFENWVRNV